MAWTAPRTWTDGELVTASIMNTHVRDNLLVVSPHLVVRKTADESVTSSTALQDDNDLLVNIPANEIWKLQWHLRYEASSAGAIKFSFGLPASGRIDARSVHRDAGSTVIHGTWALTATDGTSITAEGLGAGSIITLVIDAVVTNGGTGGNYTLRWAQSVSNATASIVKAQSTLWGMKLA